MGTLQNHLNFDIFPTQKWEQSRARLGLERQLPRQNELQQVASKMILEHFDGIGRATARAGIHELDTYLALRPMSEVDAIRFGVLHLDGAAHDWWYHELISLRHD